MERESRRLSKAKETRMRTSTSQTHLPQLRGWDTLLSKSTVSHEGTTSSALFSSTLKNMDRPLTAPEKELIPEHQVQNNHFLNSGMTVSAEPRSHYHEGQAELNVLKAILHREGILTELNTTVKKVEKKFQQIIIGLLDMIRQTSLEVVNAIENWRAIKKNYDAAFMWNSVNYLLKMPTDLDYIDQYRAITDWLGFSILRNPFVIPFPMENNPRGMKSTVSNTEMTYGDRPQSSSRLRAKFKSPRVDPFASTSSSFKDEPFSPTKQNANNISANQSVPAIADPMTLVRHAESVILFEEQKYGRLDRDPMGRIVPFDQAYMKYLAINLKKDEHRKMIEETASKEDFAPHTVRSGVGFAPRPWFPGDGDEDENEVDLKGEEEKLLNSFENIEKNPFEEITRNKQKVGGLLNSLQSRAADFRRRYPMHPNHGNDIEFKNVRKVRSLEDTLGTLNVIREKIKAEKDSYEKKLSKKQQRKSKLLKDQTEESNSSSFSPSPSNDDLKIAQSINSETTNHIELVLKQYVRIGQGDSETHSKFFDSAMIPEAEIDSEKAYEISKSMLAKEISYLLQLKKYKIYHQKLQDFKSIHHSEIVKERSRDIERKRRLLSEQEAIKRGPPGDEPLNAYDYYATKLQTQVRRWAAIRFVEWFRVESSVASKKIQTRARGMIARVRWKRLKREKDAATEIQRNYRGMACRKSTAAMARDYRDGKAAIKIQTCWRRIMAKKRVVSKRLLDQNASEAMEAVNPHNLLDSDVKELAGWIQLALNEPHEYSFPPDEVLTLLKMSSILLLAGEGYAGLTTYDQIGARYHVETTGFDIDWESAMKLINRSDKYLRRVRGLAYAPISKPPRLITLPSEVISLYKLESQNSKFSLETFENLKYGSKFCLKLFKWLDCMIQVGIAQGKFFDFIGEKFPEWLPKLFDLQKKIRKCEFEILLNEKCLIELQQVILEHTSAVKRLQKRQEEEREEAGEREPVEEAEVDHYLITIEKEKEKVEKDKNSAEQRKENYQKAEKDYGQEQNAIEIMTMKSFNEKVLKKEGEIKDAVTKYMQLHQMAEDGGDVLDIETKLQKSMDTITQLTIEMKELKIQFGLLKLQIDNNIQKRNTKKRFTSDIIYHIYQAGEAKASYLLEGVIAKAVLLLKNRIRSEDGLHLHPEVDEEYKVLVSKEKLLKLKYRGLLKLADDEVEEFHQNMISEMKQQELNEKNDTARFIPSDEELHYERLEDDQEARVERYAKLLYVSRKILNEIPKRKHPLIIAFTCDVPYDVKRTLIRKLHETIPNFFKEISSEQSSSTSEQQNMGINIVKLQQLLHENHSAIITIDHGLTQITRQNFIKNYNMIWKSLSYEPLTILIQGDELNQRTPIHDPRYGVYHRDIEKMRDYQIKYSLEKIAYLKRRFLQDHIKKVMLAMYSSLIPPSYAYVIVLEALFILISQKNNYNIPEKMKSRNGEEKMISKVSFLKCKILLIDPYLFYDKLMRLRRGQSDYKLCQIILYYTQHPLWPKEPNRERKEHEFLHLLASFVEEWVKCEILTYQKGGVPSDGSDLKIQLLNCLSVITITDSFQSSPSSSSLSSSLFEDTVLSVKKSGWMTPLTYLYRGVFHELKVYHTVRKIDTERKHDLYQINVYRNDRMIYFDAYNPKTSQCYHTSISIDDVPSLLVPSVLTIKDGKVVHSLPKSDDSHRQQSQHVQQITPPVTSTELYERLVNLLQVQRLVKIKNSKKELICKRRNIFIKRFSIKICGHNLMLNCYESGMSELYFEGYLPEHSATLIFHLNDVLRLKMLSNCDHLLEYHMLDSANSLDILPYVVDRLRIIPNKAMKVSQDCDYFSRRKASSSIQPTHSLFRATLHQGYRLVLNCKSGAGKYLIRKTIMFLGIPHVMTLKSSSINQTLRIIVYEPMAQKQQELRMNSFLRRVILHDTSENYKLWVDRLMMKLRLDYQHKRELCLDMKLYQKLHKVRSYSSRPPSSSAAPHSQEVDREDSLIITVFASTEVYIKVTLFHLITCELFECNLSKENVLDLLLFPTSPELHDQVSQESLQFLQQRREYYQTFEATKVVVLMTHILKEVSFDEIPFDEILCHRSCLQFLVKQLSSLLYKEALTDQFICLCSQRTKLYFHKPIVEETVEEKSDDVMSLVSRAYSRSSSTKPPLTASQSKVMSSPRKADQESSTHGSIEDEDPRSLEEKSGFDVSFRHRKRLIPKAQDGGSLHEVLARRRQAPVVFLEKHLDELARSKVEIARRKVLSDLAAAETLMNSNYGKYLRNSGKKDNISLSSNHEEDDSDREDSPSSSVSGNSPRNLQNDDSTIETQGNLEIRKVPSQEPKAFPTDDPSFHDTERGEQDLLEGSVGSLGSQRRERNLSGKDEKEEVSPNKEEKMSNSPVFELSNLEMFASRQVLDDIISDIETKDRCRWVERLNPGSFQKEFLDRMSQRKLEEELKRAAEDKETEKKPREILIRQEVFVFEKKLRVNYREGISRWGATAKVGIYESACWDGPEGVGRKLRFVVHDSKTNSDFEGLIRGTSHLKQILGKHGYDLIPIEKTTEMILFLCRHRLEVVRNTTSPTGEPITAPDAPIYRVEFMIPEDLEGLDKSKLSEAEEKKKKEEEEQVAQIHARGRKIVRISRRVNGLLLQLVVFQLPMTGFEGSSKLTEYQRMMTKVLEDEEKSKKTNDGRSQQRKREQMILHPAPPLRVVAYDPKTKFRDGVIIPPEAVLELAGGGYSPFLSPERRRELGRVVCESLQLDFLATGGFKLTIPWSGVKVNGRVKTTLFKLPRESISLIRPGRIFHNALRITRFNILVTAYSLSTSTNGLGQNSDVLFHFYSSTCSNDIEITIPHDIQVEYMGQTLISYLVGESRNIAITNFCTHYFDALIYTSPINFQQKLLEITLLPKRKGYTISYRDIGLPRPEEDLRSVGIPQIFMPPDATGCLLFRHSTRIFIFELNELSPIEYILSIYTKSVMESLERGVVVKAYSTIKSQTMVLHIGPNEVTRLCQESNQMPLLEEILTLRDVVIDEPKDSIEEGFMSLTRKGENIEKMKRLIGKLCTLIIRDIGIRKNSQGDDSLYSKTSKYEPM